MIKILTKYFWLLPTLLYVQTDDGTGDDHCSECIVFEDYVLSIQYFNQVINAKPYLYEPYFSVDWQKSIWMTIRSGE